MYVKKTCKNIKDLNDKILEPYLSMKLINEKTSEINDDSELVKKIKDLNDLINQACLQKKNLKKLKRNFRLIFILKDYLIGLQICPHSDHTYCCKNSFSK